LSSGNSLFESPKKEAFEAFRKQLENGAACSGEMQELSKRLNVPVATLYVWKVDFKKKLIRSGELNPSTSKMNPRDKFQAVLESKKVFNCRAKLKYIVHIEEIIAG
jgi:hypothetical protein